MPNIFDANGLQVDTRDETYAKLVALFRGIYGNDINLDPSTPDRQWLEAITQIITDLLELLVSINSSFDPDQAIGNTLIQRVAINGIEPQEGSYSTTDVEIVTSRSVTLYGLDQSAQPPYAVSDNEGNRWLLVNTAEGLNSPLGTLLAFRAELPGALLTTPNTITTPDTIVLGVVSVNNPDAQISIGSDQEKDEALKIRRRESVSLPGQGWIDALRAGLRNLSGMITANAFENPTSGVVDGIPAHGVWVITEGSVSDENIAETINVYRTGGLAMRGDKSYSIDQDGASTLIINWDETESINFFAFFTPAYMSIQENYPDYDEIRAAIVNTLKYAPGGPASFAEFGTALQDIDPDLAFRNSNLSYWTSYLGLSTGEFQCIFVPQGVPDGGQFKLRYDGETTTALDYDATDSEIQTALRLLSGLEACTVTVTVTSVLIIRITLNVTNGVKTLIAPVDVTLEISSIPVIMKNGPVPSVFNNATPLQVVRPGLLKQKFVIAPENLVFGLILFPYTRLIQNVDGPLPDLDIIAGNSVTFFAKGGYGTYTYVFVTNNSGGTLNASTGVYVAGSTPSTVDFIRVRDSLGNESVITSVNVRPS